jgi:sugar phosphate isomerase/epimerase
MDNILGLNTNTYHTYTLDEALEGTAKGGFKYIELSAVRGWTEHVPLEGSEADYREIKAKLAHWGLKPSALSGHSDLTTPGGLIDAMKAVDLCEKFELTILNTAIGGHASQDEDKSAFMGNIYDLADYAAARGVIIGLEIHGDIMANAKLSMPLIKEIDRPNVLINYDTANCEFYGDTAAADEMAFVAPFLVHVHLKDKVGPKRVWDFPAVGEGHVAFNRVLETLAAKNYTGPFGVEIEFQGLPWPPLEEVHRSVKVSYDNLCRLGLR